MHSPSTQNDQHIPTFYLFSTIIKKIDLMSSEHHLQIYVSDSPTWKSF